MNNSGQILNNIRRNNLTKQNNKKMMESNNANEFARYDNQYYNNTFNNEQQQQQQQSASLPTWKLPLQKSFTSTNAANLKKNYSNSSSSDEFSPSTGNGSNDENKFPATMKSTETDGEDPLSSPDPYVINILLPCIICNRTFSPEALERHSKICTKVNVNDVRIKPPRQQFDSAKYRIKDTKLELFIPPPAEPPSELTPLCHKDKDTSEWVFTRGGRGRSSFQDRTGNTRSSFGKGSLTGRRSVRAGSMPRSETFGEYDDGASSINILDTDLNQPSYSRMLTPSEDCPYCGRSFGLKAYDRHVSHCKEVWERKQYEIQPTPKEVEIARLRQEVRTKYKPMKGSSSLTSLRSYSPSKDNFATNALNKLFGGLKRVDNINLHGKGAGAMLTGFKRSNESLASSAISNSCYGDFNRTGSTRKRNPSTQSSIMSTSMYQPPSSTNAIRPGTLRANTTSNIPKYVNKHKSTENLNGTVQSSGYGPNGNYMSNFSRNSKNRSSLNKNFFRSSSNRVEPEGTENTETNRRYMNTSLMENYNRQPSTTNETRFLQKDVEISPLIISPMNFYTKSNQSNSMTQAPMMTRSHSLINPPIRQRNDNRNYYTDSNNVENNNKQDRNVTQVDNGSSNNESSVYDPYEKAAKQLEELFRKQPPPIHRNTRAQRKIGLDRAFASVLGTSAAGPIDDDERDSNKSLMQVSDNEQQKSFLPAFDFHSTEPIDSYWDEVLAKKTASNGNSGQSEHETNNYGLKSNENTGIRSDSSDLKSQHRRLSTQNNNKSNTDKSARASNTSSADSAFSRSDGIDLEFEALESLLELGQMPSSITTLPEANNVTQTSHNNNNSNNNDIRNNGSETGRTIIHRIRTDSSEDEPMAISCSSSSSNSSTNRNLMLMSDNSNAFDDYEPKSNGESIIKTTITPFSTFQQKQQSKQQQQLKPTLAKFCHECGTSYPTSEAKFCPECGERRVIHV